MPKEKAHHRQEVKKRIDDSLSKCKVLFIAAAWVTEKFSPATDSVLPVSEQALVPTKVFFEWNISERIRPKVIIKKNKHPSAFAIRSAFDDITRSITWPPGRKDVHSLHQKNARVKVSGVDPSLYKTTSGRTNFESWHFAFEFRHQLRAVTFTSAPPPDRYASQRYANIRRPEVGVCHPEETGVRRGAGDCDVVGAICRDLYNQNPYHPPGLPTPPPSRRLNHQSRQRFFLESRSCSKRIAETGSSASYSSNFSQDGTAAYIANNLCSKAG